MLPEEGCESTALYRLVRFKDGRHLTKRQLQYWDKTGLLSVKAAGPHRKRCYSFQDILRLRVIVALLDGGLNQKRIGTALTRLDSLQEKLGRPWHALRFVTDGNALFFLDGDVAFDAMRDQVVALVLMQPLVAEAKNLYQKAVKHAQLGRS